MKAFTNSFFDYSTSLFHFFFTPIIRQIFDLSHDYQNMGSASSSPKQVPLVSKSSSPEKIQIEFTPWILASEPISVSNDSFSLLMLPGEILPKIGEFADIGTVLNLIATCKYIRNQLNTWFLQALASKNNPDRATSGFIVDSIGDKGDTCLWRNAMFFIEDHDIPKELSIHLFTNTTAKKISSDEARSMIIQVSGISSPPDLSNPSDPHSDIRIILTSLFSKVSFKSLKCLMVCGIELSNEFSQEIGALNLDVFHMRNFRYDTNLAKDAFFDYCYPLKTLYVVHPDEDEYEDEYVYPPKELKKLVTYCPKPRNDMINGRKPAHPGLFINVEKCHALKEM